jgi:hypothetical protein
VDDAIARPQAVVASAEAEPDTRSDLRCPEPEPPADPQPPSADIPPHGSSNDDGPTVAPIEPAQPPAAGAWQI